MSRLVAHRVDLLRRVQVFHHDVGVATRFPLIKRGMIRPVVTSPADGGGQFDLRHQRWVARIGRVEG